MFLLPLFDLINHSTERKERCTTLARVDGDSSKGDGEALDAFEMRAERHVEAHSEVLHSYGQHGAAQLLRTYGFVESSPHTRMMVEASQVVAAASTYLARNGGVSLEKDAAMARVEALRSAGKLPLGEVFEVGLTVAEDLMTMVQVLVMGDKELRAWQEAGSIPLGHEWLDHETIADVMGVLLEVADTCASSHKCAVGAVKRTRGLGCRAQAAALGKALEEEEARVLSEFKRACLMLAMTLGQADDEDDDDDESDDENGSTTITDTCTNTHTHSHTQSPCTLVCACVLLWKTVSINDRWIPL